MFYYRISKNWIRNKYKFIKLGKKVYKLVNWLRISFPIRIYIYIFLLNCVTIYAFCLQEEEKLWLTKSVHEFFFAILLVWEGEGDSEKKEEEMEEKNKIRLRIVDITITKRIFQRRKRKKISKSCLLTVDGDGVGVSWYQNSICLLPVSDLKYSSHKYFQAFEEN